MNATDAGFRERLVADTRLEQDGYWVMVDPDPESGEVSESLVVVPDSLTDLLSQSCYNAVTQQVQLKDGSLATVAHVFRRDAERAEEPQNLRINRVEESRVETDEQFQDLVERVRGLVGNRLLEVTVLASQRPGLSLRGVVQSVFIDKFKWQPIFDARGVIDSSVALTARNLSAPTSSSIEETDSDREQSSGLGSPSPSPRPECGTETHMTGMIRMVIPLEGGEPTDLDKPILYDATAEFDQIHQTVTYRVSFHIKPAQKKWKCVIL